MAEWFAQHFAMMLTLCFPSTFTKMFSGCECQEFTGFRQEILLLFISHVLQLTQQDFFMDTIVLANEFVQQQGQNKATEIIMY